MQKHIPVLLNEVLTEVDQLVASKDEITIIDCTLGQAGHSEKIFEKIKQGVLISIDLDINSINWVIDSLRDKFEITSNNLTKDDENLIECFKLKDKASTENKTWYILQSDFAEISSLLDLLKIKSFDLILADLGFSNFQLNQNLGISFGTVTQYLDMRYFKHEDAIKASDVLNLFEKDKLIEIFRERGQIDDPKYLVDDIVEHRKKCPFLKTGHFLKILNKKRYPANYKVKAFQALRSYVNQEYERLTSLLKVIPDILSNGGKSLIITFNSLEEQIISKNLSPLIKKEPNIVEIVNNPQSRSAKIYIFKTE